VQFGAAPDPGQRFWFRFRFMRRTRFWFRFGFVVGTVAVGGALRHPPGRLLRFVVIHAPVRVQVGPVFVGAADPAVVV
jgi:hypothetical protein